jgi:hypothetical protein
MTEKLNDTQKRSGGFHLTVGMLGLILMILFCLILYFTITYMREVDDKARPALFAMGHTAHICPSLFVNTTTGFFLIEGSNTFSQLLYIEVTSTRPIILQNSI